MSEAKQQKPKVNYWRFIPIIIFLALSITFLFRLFGEDPNNIPSVLIQKPLPQFELSAQGDFPTFGSKDFYGDGDPKIINFWASWCLPCREEHPQLEAIQELGIKIYGISYKDVEENALQFLEEYGNIYEAIGKDEKNSVHIDFGVRKIPETFIVDNQGIIRYKQIGAILPENYDFFLKQYEAAKTPIDVEKE